MEMRRKAAACRAYAKTAEAPKASLDAADGWDRLAKEIDALTAATKKADDTTEPGSDDAVALGSPTWLSCRVGVRDGPRAF